MNEKTTTLSLRILEEEKEKLQDEANARGLTLSDVVKEMIAEKINGSSYDKDLMTKKQDVGLPKVACPFCGIVVDWSFVKVSNLSLSEDGKYCPNPDCRKLVYIHSEEKGWRKRISKTDGAEKFIEKLADDVSDYETLKEIEKRESQKPEPEPKEESKEESKEEEDWLDGIVTFDNEKKSEEEEEGEGDNELY